MSRAFVYTLIEVLLYQGTSAGVAPVLNHRYSWLYVILVRPVKAKEHEIAVAGDEAGNNDDAGTGNYMVPDSNTANRITDFHKLCPEMPDVMHNYCSITL